MTQTVWAALTASLLAFPLPAHATTEASTDARPTLAQAGTEAHWSGSVPQAVVGDPALCTPATCEDTELVLQRAVPRLVVAIDTSQVENTFDFGYDIRLHLYDPAGHLVASDDSSFESNVVVVDDAPAGTWRVVIAPDQVLGELPYRGYAAATRPPKLPARRVDLRPNLVARPPTNLQVAAAPFAGPPPVVWDFRGQAKGPSSCYPQETIELGALRCLRFDQTVANLGAGPLELFAAGVGDGPMTQRVHRSDGTTRDREVGAVRLHVQHLHFHYEDYAQVRLYEIRTDGGRGGLVREGRKQGFCLADTRNMRFGRPDQVQARYVDPETCDGRDEPPGFSRVGLTPGWADTYPWFISEQFIEISGVPDGRYELEFSVNGACALEEERHDDNAVSVVFDLAGSEVRMVEHARDAVFSCAGPR